MNPSNRKLHDLVSREYPNNLQPDTRKLLEDISKACHACKTFSKKPVTFQVRFREDVVFNKQVRLDLMSIEGYSVLHIVDARTNYSAARLIER